MAPLLLLFLLPLALRGAGLEHGSPRGYVPDTHIVKAALGMARDKHPVPPVGKYSAYPNLLPYMLLPLYIGDYVAGRVSGRWGGAEEFGNYLQLHPEEPHLIARWLIAVLGSLTPLIMFAAARAAGLRRGAWVTGALVATCLLQVQFCTQQRPWAPMTMFIALTAWGSIVHVRTGSARALRMAGVAAGLAFATHQAGLSAIGLCGLAWFLSAAPWKGLSALLARAKVGLACVALFVLVSVLLGHPYWLLYGRTAAEAVVGGAEQNAASGAFTLGGMTIIPQIRMESFSRLSRVLIGYDPVLLGLGLVGTLLSLRQRALWPVLIWTYLIAAFFLTAQSDHARYLLPPLVLLSLPAGFLGERLLQARAGRLALALLLALPLVQSLRFISLLRTPDTRSLAEVLLTELPAGSRVAIDRYGPLVDLSRSSLELLASLREETGSELYGREQFRLAALEAEYLPAELAGIDAVRFEDVFTFPERSTTVEVREGLDGGVLGEVSTPPELFRALKITHVLAVRRRDDAQHPHIFAAELAEMEHLERISPGGQSSPREAFLPLEMDFPLTALWSVERPGPILDLYRVR